MTNNMTK